MTEIKGLKGVHLKELNMILEGKATEILNSNYTVAYKNKKYEVNLNTEKGILEFINNYNLLEDAMSNIRYLLNSNIIIR